MATILRDIREGLNQLRRTSDNTYMYDDEVRALAPHHWYDEPPYESDPEDFLMRGGNGQSTATLQNGRVCFTLNMRPDRQREGIISHPSAGDISIPRESDSAPRRGLILPQYGPYPPAIIPLTHARSNRGSGDYAGTDVQSLSSRLSTFSMETTRSEQNDYCHLSSSRKKGSSDQSSDYEDHDMPLTVGRSGFEGSSRGKQKHKKSKDKKEFMKMKGNLQSASSGESLPSGSGSSTQALMRETSGHSSLSAGDDRDNSSPIGPAPQGGTIPMGPVIARARALVDCSPSHYDREALRFKKGDIIDVLQMNPSGLWQGIAHGKAGLFKFINVELLSDKTLKRLEHPKQNKRGKPKSVEELLKRISMEEHTSVFVLNGYEDVELFQDLESQDLDYLNIRDPEHRAKILTAVQLLHDYDSNDDKEGMTSSESTGGSSNSSSEDESLTGSLKPSKQGPPHKSLRDSGCFEEDQHSGQRKTRGSSSKSVESSNNLDSVGRNIFFTSDGRKPQTTMSGLKQFKNSDSGGQSSEIVEMDVFANHAKVNYQPNIPVSDHQKKNSAKEFLEQTREVLNRAREIANNSREILERSGGVEQGGSECAGPGRTGEDQSETNTKLTMVKYGTGYNDLGLNCEGGNAGFSEKSSDSGVSSSSMSSSNFKERKMGQTVPTESPKPQRQDSPRKAEKGGKVFSLVSDARKIETLNPFLKNCKSRLVSDGTNKSNERSDSKTQEIGSPNSFSSQFPNRSLIVQKKT
ncbi:hypothetical protein RUM44_004533 [Polyplax serrata]|uniref:SAM and SH3 domain-containing protein 1 n=1 Tax=Polyplax serrata TaxID=468196 RepID=A0ABR1B331_POLSC